MNMAESESAALTTDCFDSLCCTEIKTQRCQVRPQCEHVDIWICRLDDLQKSKKSVAICWAEKDLLGRRLRNLPCAACGRRISGLCRRRWRGQRRI